MRLHQQKSDRQYGNYEFCSSTDDPPGKECINLTIRNLAATAPYLLTTIFSKTKGSKEVVGMSSLIIAPIVIGVLLILIVFILVWCKKRKKPGSQG